LSFGVWNAFIRTSSATALDQRVEQEERGGLQIGGADAISGRFCREWVLSGERPEWSAPSIRSVVQTINIFAGRRDVLDVRGRNMETRSVSFEVAPFQPRTRRQHVAAGVSPQI